MRVLEQLQMMRQLGVSGSDDELTMMLKKAGYNLEQAISDHFEASSPTKTNERREDPVTLIADNGKRLDRKEGHKRQFPDCAHDSNVQSSRRTRHRSTPPVSSFTVKESVSLSNTNIRNCIDSQPGRNTWLLGRRVSLGYTLNSGFALREAPLRLKFEGMLAHSKSVDSKSKNSSSATLSKSSPPFGNSRTKKKQKFSAANLMFECGMQSSMKKTTNGLITGRLSNLICNFLVPLLQHKMIIVTGHIAFDCGQVGRFQDLPLSLQIHATDQFLSIMSRDNESSSSTSTGTNALQFQEKENLQAVAKAGNELLIWLTQGENALLSCSSVDKKLDEYSQAFAPGSANNDAETQEDESLHYGCSREESDSSGVSQGTASIVMTEVMTKGNDTSLVAAPQPALIKGIQMKKYQLEALQWMKNREGLACEEGQKVANGTPKSHSRQDTKIDSDDDDVEVAVIEVTSTFKIQASLEVHLPIEGIFVVPPVAYELFPPLHQSTLHKHLGKTAEDICGDNDKSVSLWTPIFALNSSHEVESLESGRVANFYMKSDVSNLFRKLWELNCEPMKVLWWNRYTQVVCSMPPPQLTPCRGGILADQMGLGKTIMTIALIVSDKEKDSNDQNVALGTVFRSRHSKPGDNFSRSKSRESGGTLVVCPLSLMSQWLEEFRNRVACKKGDFRVVMYYGSDRQKFMTNDRDADYDQECDTSSAHVVVTSYGVLTSEWRRFSSLSTSSSSPRNENRVEKSQSVLLGRVWRRVVLDEGHTIRNPATETTRACHMVQAERRWVLSGTPIQNKIDDLYSLMKFLHHQPWDKWRWWYTTISQPIQQSASVVLTNPGSRTLKKNSNSSVRSEGMDVVRQLLSTIMLRRTKETVDSETGESIVSLPPRDVHYVFVDLTPVERSFYNALAKRSSNQMLGIVARQQHVANPQGLGKKKSLITGYAELFTLLMRLRQTCSHPVLVLNSLLDKASLDALLNGQYSVKMTCAQESAIVNQTDANSDECSSSENCGKLNSIKNKLLENERKNGQLTFLNEVLKSLEMSWQGPEGVDKTFDSDDKPERPRDGLPIEQQECCVCFEYLSSPDDTALTPCGHIMCWECAILSIDRNSSCPVCMREITSDQLIPIGERCACGDDKQNCNNEAPKERSKSTVMRSFLTSSNQNGARMLQRGNHNKGGPNILGDINWQTSSKLAALQEELENIFFPENKPIQKPEGNGGEDDNVFRHQNCPKVVIFSQWTGMLDLVEIMLQNNFSNNINNAVSSTGVNASGTVSPEERRTVCIKNVTSTAKENGIKCNFRNRNDFWARFDGSMSQSQRSQTLHRFSTDSKTRILLISLKAGGVGLNLTAASYLFLLDPWWNPAVEDQAIDRVHRLGQIHPVKIMRMVCRGTVEEKLIALQAKKRQMSQQALSSTGQGTTGEPHDGSSSNKLSLEELKGLFL